MSITAHRQAHDSGIAMWAPSEEEGELGQEQGWTLDWLWHLEIMPAGGGRESQHDLTFGLLSYLSLFQLLK